jgi:AraC-like DNA-binding protein
MSTSLQVRVTDTARDGESIVLAGTSLPGSAESEQRFPKAVEHFGLARLVPSSRKMATARLRRSAACSYWPRPFSAAPRSPSAWASPSAAYLTRWRMDLAARALRDSDDPIDVIARSVGYTSEYAFSRAFSRDRALPPGRYRTHSRTDPRHPRDSHP